MGAHVKKLLILLVFITVSVSVVFAGRANKTELENGLTVITKEIHTVPIVSCMIWYNVGSRDEIPGHTGLSHFLEHMMFKGTDKYKKGDIDLITLKNGGSNNAFTSNDYTAYYFNFASDRWEVALEIEANRMRNCTFVDEEYQPERKVVIEERKIGMDRPARALEEEVRAAAFKVHPYRNPVIGWMHDLETMKRQDMMDYYNAYYQPNNAIMVIVGDFDTEKLLPKIKELFGTIPKGPEPRRLDIVEPEQRGERRVTLNMKANLPRLRIAYHTPQIGTTDAYTLAVIENILSGGKSSRLYQILVEQLQLVSSVYCSYEDDKDPSLFSIVAELKPEVKLRRVEDVILQELEKLKTEPVSDRELQKSINQVEAAFVFNNETTLFQAYLLGAAASKIDYRYYDTYVDSIRTVTKEAIMKAAQTYFNENNRTVGWLVPKGQEEKQKQSHLWEAHEYEFASADSEEMATVRAFYKDPSHPDSFDLPVPFQPNGLNGYIRKYTVSNDKLSVKTVPAIQPLEQVKPLDVKRWVLDNGLIVLILENPAIPAVSINAMVRAGGREEPEAKAGLASFVGRMLDEGTETRTSLEIAEAIEFVGGRLSTYGGYAASGVRVSVLKKDVELGLELASDLLMHPKFDPEQIEKERGKILAEIKSANDNPRSVAARWFNELVYQGHPHHKPSFGYEETVKTIAREDMVDFHHRYYLPNNTILAIVGDVKAAEVMEMVKKKFTPWKKGRLEKPEIPEIKRQKGKRIKYVYQDKEQINLYLGHLGIERTNPDYYALQVMDYILGTGPGFTDRISKNLRDTQGLAYTVYGNITRSAGIDPGTFTAYIGTSPQNKDKAINGLLGEIKRIIAEPVSQEELQNAKDYLTGSYVFDFQTNAQLARYLLDAEIYNLGFDYLTKYPKLIQAVTVEDVQQVAKKYLDADNYSLVIVGRIDEKSGEIVEEKK